ncbi:serine hydrolase [Patescibacteria group bacterium]|nr:serine hydrolase [Patescibacteria group bacterium]
MKKYKFFIIVFLISLPFWFGVNIFQKTVEDFFYAKAMEKIPPLSLVAQISLHYPKVMEPQISATSAILVKINEQGEEQIIFKKKEKEKMAIASLTKLMTGLIALEFYQPDLKTKISEKAVSQLEQTGLLKMGERLSVKDLLYIALIESSNDAAFALAEIIDEKAFVDLMNLKAKDIGLQDTHFFNPSGVDAETFDTNYSTVSDLVKLAKYVWLKNPLIFEILLKKEYPLYLSNGKLHHIIYNTNALLGENLKIISGKTGFTSNAGECLLLLFKGKKAENYYIAVVLNSQNRFEDMKKLIEYIQ